jgi:hypothetical protein
MKQGFHGCFIGQALIATPCLTLKHTPVGTKKFFRSVVLRTKTHHKETLCHRPKEGFLKSQGSS